MFANFGCKIRRIIFSRPLPLSDTNSTTVERTVDSSNGLLARSERKQVRYPRAEFLFDGSQEDFEKNYAYEDQTARPLPCLSTQPPSSARVWKREDVGSGQIWQEIDGLFPRQKWKIGVAYSPFRISDYGFRNSSNLFGQLM